MATFESVMQKILKGTSCPKCLSTKFVIRGQYEITIETKGGFREADIEDFMDSEECEVYCDECGGEIVDGAVKERFSSAVLNLIRGYTIKLHDDGRVERLDRTI